MSQWSSVYGVVEVDTLSRSSPETMYIAQTVVNNLPKIYGSEGCAKYYLNLVNGYNISSDTDGFGNFSNLMQYETWLGQFEWQTKALITVKGELRDTDFKRTLKETTKMLNRLSSRLMVTKCLVKVSSNGESFLFCDPDWVINREQPNDPLTLEQLQEMVGEPVWVVDHCSGNYACRVITIPDDHFTDGHLRENRSYGSHWTAYRRKPEGGV